MLFPFVTGCVKRLEMTIPAVETGFREIPLESLVPSPFNVRSIRTKARIAEVAQSLAADGQREAITVYPGTGADTEKYLIVSGVTRYLAAKSLGWETLTAQVDASLDPGNALALVRASRTHNDTVRETDLDHAFVARELLAAGHTAAEVAEALGCSRRDVTRLKTCFELPPSILELGKTRPEKFSASFAESLKKAVGEIGAEKAQKLLKRCLEENLSLRELERLVHTEERRQQRDARQRPWQEHAFDIRRKGGRIGSLNVWETPDQKQKILLSVLLDKTTGERLNARLTEFLERFMAEAEMEGEDGD
jgi:ParB/RepB/Spo0J family partition protein